MLTQRQLECVTLFAHDYSLDEIAKIFGIEKATVQSHLNEARSNLFLERRTSLIVYYHQQPQMFQHTVESLQKAEKNIHFPKTKSNA